jgi:hypothetical protein
VEVFPNAEFINDDKVVEMDVVIPCTSTGIECKCYANNLAVTRTALKSQTAQLKKQVLAYSALGLKRVFIITNYCDADANSINLALKEQLKGTRVECRVLSSDITEFTRFLDEESDRINNTVAKDLQKQVVSQTEHQRNKLKK